LLKNLGLWLGRLSLARNKPIRFDQLDMKALLIEAFEQVRAHPGYHTMLRGMALLCFKLTCLMQPLSPLFPPHKQFSTAFAIRTVHVAPSLKRSRAFRIPCRPRCITQGKMVAVIPFVGKVLDSCKDSKVLQWINAICNARFVAKSVQCCTPQYLQTQSLEQGLVTRPCLAEHIVRSKYGRRNYPLSAAAVGSS
jgi:hypothetical protein